VTMRVGFVGIGSMGLPMALRLMDQGYSLSVFDIRQERVSPLIARGARAASSPADVASEVRIVLVNLPTPEVVREVALGPRGIIEGSAVRIYADLSTTGPKVAGEVSNAFGKKGIAVFDAPVSGNIPGAEKGTLTVMVSGPLKDFEQIQPILKVLGKNVCYVGEKAGLGQMMKLINNLLSGTAMIMSCEAFVLGVKAGLDPEIMVKIINSSTGRNSATEEKFPRAILPRTFDLGFTIDIMYKDIKLCLEEAEALQIPMWMGNVVRQFCVYALGQGGGPRDGSTIIQYMEAWAGVEVGKVALKESRGTPTHQPISGE
jgi:3-hydroxyisobutyrate dehydrogenase-like beta-hydroxyacid dehydrogenase